MNSHDDTVVFPPFATAQVLGTLRQQLLYPTWTLDGAIGQEKPEGSGAAEGPWWKFGRWGSGSGSASDAAAAAPASGDAAAAASNGAHGNGNGEAAAAAAAAPAPAPAAPLPTDADLVSVLETVRLGHLVQRGGLDEEVSASFTLVCACVML